MGDFVLYLRGVGAGVPVLADRIARHPNGEGLEFWDDGRVVFVLPDESDMIGLSCVGGIGDDPLFAVRGFSGDEKGST